MIAPRFVAMFLATACAVTAQEIPQKPEQEPTSKPSDTQKPKNARVIVTARKWEEPLRELPQSVTTFSRSMLDDAGVDSIRDASLFVPNTLITEFTSRRLSFPFIRGIGSGQGDPAVTTFVDGVPQLTVSSTNIPLADAERVEFLRGPAGALYGRNTIGGAIHILTEEPSDVASADADILLGNFQRQDYRVRVSAPISETAGFSVTGLHSRREGYTVNDFTDDDVNDRSSFYGRGQLVWRPDDADTLKLTVYGEGARDGGFVLSELNQLRQNPNRITQDFQGSVDRDIFSSTLTWDRDGDDFEFDSITSVQDWSIDETADFDFSQIDGIRRFTSEEQTYLYQEFRVGSADGNSIDLGNDTELRWLAGVSGFYSDSERSATNEFRPSGANILFAANNVGSDRAAGRFDDWALGLFAQATLSIEETWDITGAVRWDYEEKEATINRTFTPAGFPALTTAASAQTERFDEILPRGSVAYHANENVTTYGLAARGFKAGGFNLTAPAGNEAFGTETSWTYELGVKTDWQDETIRANAAIFYIDWEDMQLSQFNQNTGGFVTNAGEATSQGVEVELQADLVEDVTVFGNFGYMETEFDRFTDQFGQNVSGRDLPFAPETTWGFGAQYSTAIDDEIRVFARADHFRIGEFFYDAGNLGSESYHLTNLRFGVRAANWSIEGWVDNLLDHEYVPIAFQANPGNPNQFVGESAAPRTYGVMMKVDF